MGKRLGELTKENTKCMIDVNGQKLIDRMLDQLAALKLKRVVIVVGYQAENLKHHIGNRYDGKLKIEYVLNPIYDKTNNIYSLALAKKELQEYLIYIPFSTGKDVVWTMAFTISAKRTNLACLSQRYEIQQ